MPMIDVFAPAGLFPPDTERPLAEQLTAALLRAEGQHNPGRTLLNNTAAYIHALPPAAVHTAATANARVVRVQILTPPKVLAREAQKSLVAEITDIVARTAGDPTQAVRTWVLLTEAAEGGWGIAGTAFGAEEFARTSA